MKGGLQLEQRKIKVSLKIERILWVLSFLLTIILALSLPSFDVNSKELRTVLLGCLGIISVTGLVFSFFEGLEKQFGYHFVKDLRKAIQSLVIFFQLAMLYLIIFHNEAFKEFTLPEVRWFVILISMVGLVGAIWAILARIDASRAFESSEKIRKSISTSFQFEKLVKKDLLLALSEPFDDMTIVLGIPAVGFFEKEIRSSSLLICDHLAGVLKAFDKKDQHKKFTLLFFSNDKIAEYLLTSYIDESLTYEEIESFDDELQNLCRAINKAKKVLGSNLRCYRYEVETGLRFITNKSKKLGDYMEKAVIWVVTDFKHENPGQFKAAGFITEDETIVDQFTHLGNDYSTQLKGEECNHSNSQSLLELVFDKLLLKHDEEKDPNKKDRLKELCANYFEARQKSKSGSAEVPSIENNSKEIKPISSAPKILIPIKEDSRVETIIDDKNLDNNFKNDELIVIQKKIYLRGSVPYLSSKNLFKDNSLLYLMLNLPFSCNYRCLKCCNLDETKQVKPTNGRLTLSELERMFEESQHIGIKVLVLAGEGEPLIDKDFKEIISLASKNNLIPYIFTNGTMLSESNIEFLAEHRASLIINLDSLQSERYKRLSGRDGDLSLVLSNIEKCRAVYSKLIDELDDSKIVSIAINTVATRVNVDEVYDIKKFCANDVAFVCNRPTKIGFAEKNWELLYGSTKIEDDVDAVITDLSKEHGPLGSTSDGSWCIYMKNGVSVGYDGSILTCAYAIETSGGYGKYTPGKLSEVNTSIMHSVDEFYHNSGHSRCILRHPKYKDFVSTLSRSSQ